MKKWIIFIISVIVLLTLFLTRYKYFVTYEGNFVRVNRITGKAKVFEYDHRGRFIYSKKPSSAKWDFSGLEKDKGIDAILEQRRNK